MRELVTKSIDGKLYEFQQFNTTKSLKTLSKLTKFLGEPLMLGLAALGVNPAKSVPGAAPITAKGFLDRELNGEALAKAVAALVDRLDETDVVELVKTLTSESVLCDHKPIVFDEHFRGDIGHLFKVIGAALEAQYGNFLGAVTGRPAT
jgi:hypothetical protein